MSQLVKEAARAWQCPYCGAPSWDHFCAACNRVQPAPAGVDYFAFFGLPRLLCLDEAALEKSFHALSRKLHPDYFMSASPEERQASLERSSMLNDAYRTLRDPITRVQYLLSREGYKEAEKRAPADLLEEVFELNMRIEELKNAKKVGDEDEAMEARKSLEEALASLKQRLARIEGQIFGLFGKWDELAESAETEKKSVLDGISRFLSNRSYISSLIREIEEEF